MRKHIHVWHLEITERHKIPAEELPRHYSLQRLKARLPELLRFLYITVGAPWCWYVRLRWKYHDWLDRLEDDRVEFWIAYIDGAPAGYFELEIQLNHSVEICYFGMAPDFIGQGHGKALLADAIQKAWQLGAKRVWLHTCSLDHPSALDNYLKRGFVVFKEEDLVDDIPDTPIEPWTGAGKP